MATIDELLNTDAETGDDTAPPATAETPAETPQDSPESTPEKTVPLRALEDERQKRQTYEQALVEAQRQNAAMLELLQKQNQPKSEPERVPDFLTENEQWTQQLYRSIGQLLDAREQQSWTQRVAAAEEDMREEHADYDALIDQHFKPAAMRDPTLQQKLRAAANPAKFAYRTAKRLQAETELGPDLDLDKLRAKVEAEVRAKVLAEWQQKQGELAEKVKLPVSLGTEGSSGAIAGAKVPPEGYRARDLYD